MIDEQLRLGGDLRINRVGYGTMKLTGWPRGGRPDRDTGTAILRRAVELGVNHLDTSNYYARDGVAANELIRAALHPYPGDLVIVTKVGALVEGDDILLPPAEQRGLTPDGLRRGVEANLRSLGVDRLDVVNLRLGDRGHPDAPLEAALETLMSLRAEGLIRHLGISNVSRAEFERARAVADIVCVQNLYNIAARADDPLVDACAAAGVAYVPFFPVGGFQPLTVAQLATVADRRGATVPQVALAWLLARSPAIALIPGTGSLSHLEENVAAGRLRLTDDDLALLGAAVTTPAP
ncbi:oxidoreductase [Asanoa sp. WMMD1127]|uniref:oxidoreductase n=1 Tax=Asanoa sp. WMMD1127 TaxID=3016107 RepID=UPI0024173D1C|nr:oxidoreductase [Asanoa sp. WMMD1127]MDG4827659.1 oxidoreductase [Asanoa sp. WMMD1127]